VNLSGWLGVGLGGNCDCSVVSYMLLCWGEGGFAGLVSLTSSPYPSPYSSELYVLGGGLVCLQGFAVCACE